MNIIQDIQLLIKLRAILQGVAKMNIKTGYKTTEFWVTILGNIAGVVLAIHGLIPAYIVAVLASSIPVYVVARTIVKMTPTTVDDTILYKVGEILKAAGVVIPEDTTVKPA
jgi:hypothetical protein